MTEDTDPRNRTAGTTSAICLAADAGSCALAQGLVQEDSAVFHELAEGSFAGIFLSQGMVFTYVNPAMLRFFGYESEDLLGKLGLLDLIHHDDWVATEAYLKARLDGDSAAQPHTFRGVNKSGAVVICNVVALRTEHDAEPGLIGIIVETRNEMSTQRYIESVNKLHEDLLAPGALDQKLKRITDAIVEIFDADFARIWITRAGDLCTSGCAHADVKEGPHVCEFRDRCLHLVSSSGRYTHTDGEVHRRVPFGCYKIGRVAAGADPKFITNDVVNDPRVHDHRWASELGLVAFAGYRLLSASGEPKGVMALFSKTVITPDVDALLATLANTTAQLILTAEAEEALRDSEEKHSKLFHHSYDAIIIHDLSGNIIDVNKKALDVLGYAKADILSLKVPDLHPAQALQASSRAFETISRDGVVRFEILFKGADGKVFPGEVSSSVFRIGDREVVQAIVRDITERKRVEEALRRSEREKALILDSTSELISFQDRDLKVIWANRATTELGGKKQEELLGRHCFEVWQQREEPCENCPVVQTIETGKSAEAEMTTPDGRVWLIRANPVEDDDGNIIGAVEVTLEITARKHAVEALKRSEKELTIRDEINSVFLTIPDDEAYWHVLKMAQRITESRHGLFICRGDGNSFRVSSTTLDIPEGFRTGASTPGFTPKEWGGIWERAVVEMQAQCENRPIELAAAGVVFQRVMLVPMVDHGGLIGILAVADKPDAYDERDSDLLEGVASKVAPILKARLERDREERRRLEVQDEKEEIQTKLLEVHKMEAVGRLAGGVAHDFNNLLSTIRGYCDLAIRNADEASAMHGDLTHIREAADKAARLTRQLLLFGRKQPMEISLIDVNAVVRGMLDMLSRLIGEDISVTAGLEPWLWSVRGDRSKLEQAILNLVVNAKDAMPNGGCVTITTENVTLDEEQCGIIVDACPGKYVCLSINDQGSGMDQATLQHIFEPFFTTKEGGQSSGLGLSVAHGIVKQHGGWINVYTEPGNGSTFKIFLVALASKAEDAPIGKRSLDAFRGNGERVLVVEDEDQVRELVVRILKENNYAAVEAAGADEAVSLFNRENGQFDLVMSDVVLADDSGIKLADELLSLKPDLKILLNSGYTDEKSQWPLIRERGFRFLHKPFTLVDLLGAVKAALGPDDGTVICSSLGESYNQGLPFV